MRILSLLGLAATLTAATPAEFFEKEIRPILAERCYGCHSPASQPVMGGLRMDSRELMLQGGSRGPALVPGDPAASLLLRAVRHDGALKMPPTGKLREAEIAALTQWVRDGAIWGASLRVSERTPVTKFWSFQPVREPALPPVKNLAGVRSPLDRFILSALEAKGLAPAPPASKRALLRRATFDLTGLPPTVEEINSFLADNSPEAFSRVVERLLASPRYGERWGRHWLDVARYADSNGLDENLVFINAWRYRDYVIQAFNEDRPFDRFIHEQLAGDLLPSTGNPDRDYQQSIATGFLSLGAKMLAEDDPVKMEMDIVDEQVDTMARAFMGLTLGCARCHDHKFDPIPSADYYSLAGIFRSTKTMENFKVVAKWHEHVLAPSPDRARLKAHEDRIEALRKDLAAVTKPANRALQDAARARAGDYLAAAGTLLAAQSIELPPIVRGPEVLELNHTFQHQKEFTFQLPKAGRYQLDIHYASPEARPVALFLNGELMKSKALAPATGTATADTWSVEGVFEFAAGANTIRLERPGNFFPHTGGLRLAPVDRPWEQLPQTAHQLAHRFSLNPEFLQQWVDYLRRTQDDENNPLRDWHLAAPPAREAVALRLGREFTAAAAAQDPGEKQKQLREILTDKFGPFAVPGNAARFYPPETAARVKEFETQIKALEKETPVFPRAMGVVEGKPADLRIHLRGNHLTLGDTVPRRFLRVIAGEGQPAIPPDRSGRLELARWLTEPSHPLTARVMVNRIWRWHFGRGIVASVDNFGRLGDAPSNQPLLDWLALRFLESGWSVKQMHRLIMLSSVYQMSTAYNEKAFQADPDNQLLWRMNRRRLEAEAIRDSLYAVSGLLDTSAGGTMLTFKDREYVTSTENRDSTDYNAARRAIYLPVVRSSLYDVFQAFDFGDPSVLNGDRPTTIVAPQALFLMNGAPVRRASAALAALVREQTTDPNERVTLAYERALGRPATSVERGKALAFIERAQSEGFSNRAWESFCHALLATNEFIYLE